MAQCLSWRAESLQNVNQNLQIDAGRDLSNHTTNTLDSIFIQMGA
jgi:hypothetical protein